MRHIPVLAEEVIELIGLTSNQNAIDCTLGDGGHTELLLRKVHPNGQVLGIDADPESILRAKKFLYGFGKRVIYIRDNFVHIKEIVEKEKFGPVHGILVDLGWSSPQFEDRGRGFTFQKDEPLDMRYSTADQSLTAEEIVNESSQEELSRIFREYGEEKLHKEISAAIVEARKEESIETTKQLSDIILAVYREKLRTKKDVPWIGGLHPATKVFQAIRIVVNNELGVVEQILPAAIDVLAPGGRLAVITFHSLEDRIVKHYFKSKKGKTIQLVNKKPVSPSPKEQKENSRAQSAKLRVVEKI